MNVGQCKAIAARWVKEPIDDDMGYDAINSAVQALWRILVDVNPGEYLSRQPDRLTLDTEIIPFEEIVSSYDFIWMYVVGQFLLHVHEYDAASAWNGKADAKRQDIILECLKKLPRPEFVEPYNPRGVHTGSIRWP